MPYWSKQMSSDGAMKNNKYWPLSRSSSRSSRAAEEEEVPLSGDYALDEDLAHEEKAKEDREWYENRSRTRSRFRPLLYHAVIVGIYSLAFIGAIYNVSKSPRETKHLVYSPLHEAIEPEKKTVFASFKSQNPFKGKPSDELDHAWHELFINSNVRVTEEDLAKINKTSVPITDERGGYYAIPDVYHQLHCLKFLRQVIYRDYYHIEKPTTPIHIDHCIDNLRQNLMCKGDVSLVTFSWVAGDRAPKPNFDIEHECVNWQKIDDWAKEHRFDIFDEKTLVHPTLGPSFPEAEYKATGRVPGHPDFRPNHYDPDHDKIDHQVN